MSGRPWTERELALLRSDYRILGARTLAVAFRRTYRGVSQRAMIEGLTKSKRPWTPQELRTLRRLNRLGWTDTRIAAELGRDRHGVGDQRQRLRLPSNGRGAEWRQAISAGVQRQCERLGVVRVTELRTVAFRKFAIESGWPEDLPPREVQILNALAARGVPMTRLELAAAIGMRTDREDRPGHLAVLAGNGPGGTYTANLLRRGLLLRLKRAVSGFGKGANRDLYYMAPAALAILEARACKETENSI